MGIAFDAPSALLLLPPLLAVVIALHLSSRRRLGKGRRRAALLVRVLLLTFLVGALAGLQLVLPVDRLAVVFVVDLSDSVGTAGREDALAYLRESLAEKQDEDVAGIVAFGADALVERLPSDLAEIDRIASTPVRDATDIGAALRLAGALFPDDAQKRIVLLSDGNDTTGSGQSEAALAAARGIQVETVLTGLGGRDEALVQRLTSPSTARLGESVDVSGDITSSVEQPATVRLFVNGELAGTKEVALDAGTTRVTFNFTPKDPGFLRFRMVVEAARDTFNQNDRAEANTIVKGEPKVLVVKGDETVAAELVTALETERQVVDTVIPEGLPSDLAGLADYDSIVLVDVPRLRLTDKAMAALQVYVRDLGRGLVMVGGPRSYGAGGYTDTPLEETLPVDMGVRDREKQPDVALVVVIDKSGSMDACHCNSFDGGMGGGSGTGGARKVDIGKEAILRAASALSAKDELGVVAFDQDAHWVIQTAPLGGLQDIQAQIAGITPNGQTNIFAGLDQAVQSLEGATATRRHIILLTDGWSSSGQYDAILKQMKADGITLSTVGAGGGSNPFLEKLAKDGGGRFYNAANPASIPDIFLKETQQVSGQQIVEEPFFPILTSSSPVLRGIDDGLPRLPGLQRHDRQAGGADGAGHRARRPAARAVAVRAGAGDRLDVGLDRPLGAELGAVAGLLALLQPDGGLDVPGRGERRHRGVVRRSRRADLPAGREPGQRRHRTRLLHDQRGPDRAGPRGGHRRPQPGRLGRLRGPDRAPRERRLRRPGDADAARRRAAGPDAGPRGADGGRVPPARGERAAAGRDPVGHRRARGRHAGRALDPRPPDHQPVHRPVALAARARAAAVAAGHRAAAGLARPARAGGRSPLGDRSRPRPARRASDGARDGAVRRPGSRRLVRRPVGDPARRDRGRGTGRHGRRGTARASGDVLARPGAREGPAARPARAAGPATARSPRIVRAGAAARSAGPTGATRIGPGVVAGRHPRATARGQGAPSRVGRRCGHRRRSPRK